VTGPRALVFAAILAGAPSASADVCAGYVRVSDLDVWAGATLSPTRECGSFVVATDASVAAFSWGAMTYTRPLASRYELSFTWQRLSGDGTRTLEVHVQGGVILFKPGRLAFFESEPQLARDGWTTLPGHDNYLPHRVQIVVDGARVMVRIDDRLVGEHTWSAAPSGMLRIALKGRPGLRARMLVRRLQIRNL
jgi:hypothetical protein